MFSFAMILIRLTMAERKRFGDLLRESTFDQAASLDLRLGELHRGFEWVDIGLTMLPHHDIFNRYRQRRSPPKYRHTVAVMESPSWRPLTQAT